jgi:putative FmdB family regulatory protein
MAIYEFICHNCEVIWEREAPMSKAPSRSRCPECKKLSNRHWGEVPVMFNGSDYYTNKRKQHNLVYNDKAKGKEIAENLLDASKRMAETKTSPYASYTLSKEGFESLNPKRRNEGEKKKAQEARDELKASVYNNSQAYRNLGKR